MRTQWDHQCDSKQQSIQICFVWSLCPLWIFSDPFGRGYPTPTKTHWMHRFKQIYYTYSPDHLWEYRIELVFMARPSIVFKFPTTVKLVCNDHLHNKIYCLWFIQQCVLMKTACTNLLLLTISAFWSSSRWPLVTYMGTRRQRSIPLGGRYRQASL